MPNALTAVPQRSVPPPGRLAAAAVPIADLFMLLMWSRPAGGSLRRVWVTPATLALCAVATGLGIALTAVLAMRAAAGATVLIAVALVACALLTLGAASVTMVALDQRRPR